MFSYGSRNVGREGFSYPTRTSPPIIRVCLSANALWFLDEYVSTYRVSDDAVSKRNYLQPFAYDAIESADVPQEAAAARGQALRDLASGAASGFARLNRPKKGAGNDW